MVIAAAAATANAPPAVESVVVTAQKPQVQTLVDRKVYTVSAELLATTGSAADILNTLPSVEVDADGALTLRGDSSVTVLVDGKPSAQLSGPAAGLGLLQFPASDIDKVEVMTTPPAQYKVDGSGGVINIITKKSRSAGLAGTAQLSLGDMRRFVSAVNLSYGAGPLTLSGGIGLRQEYKQRTVTDHRVQGASGAQTVGDETLNEQLRRLTPSFKLGAEYRLTPRSSVGGSLNYHELTGDRYFDQLYSGGPPTSVTTRHSDGYEWDKDLDSELHFEQKLARPDETFSLSAHRSLVRERERYAYLSTGLTPATAPTRDHLHLSIDLVTTELSADYVLPLPHDQTLKLGLNFEDDNNQFDNFGDTVDPATGLAVSDPTITNHFRYRQDISAAYGDYRRTLGRWTVQTGLRLEQTDTKARLLDGQITNSGGYFRAYPSLHLDRELTDQSKLSISIARRVNRPNAEALNPFSDHQDIHNLRAGNPKLLPQDTIALEAGYNFETRALSYGVTGYYRFTRDAFTTITTVVSDGVLLTTGANLPKSRSGGAEFTANGKITQSLSYKLSGNLFTNEIDATPIGGAGLRSATGLNLKASLDYRPTKIDAAQVSFSRSDRRLTAQGSVGPVNILNLGYRRQMAPSLALVSTYSDALNGQNTHRRLTTPVLSDDYQRLQRGRILYVGLTYAFGAPKTSKPQSFEYEP